MPASQTAARKCANWLAWRQGIGWSESDMPALADLWWKYHDEETGELLNAALDASKEQK